VVVGLLLIPLNAYWLAIVELVRNTQTPTSVSLFFNVVFTVVLVSLVNAPLRRWAPRLALSRADMGVVYVLTALGSAMAGIDMLCCLIPIMAYPFHYASPENGWNEVVLPWLRRDLMVTDPTALANFWAGGSSLYQPENLSPWLLPLARWHVLIVALTLLVLALAAVFRKRWIESERLTYPIAQVPMELTLQPERLCRDRWFWLALGTAVCIDVLNGLHALKPAVPQIPVRSSAYPGFNVGAQLIDRPWNAVGFMAVSFYPFVIGLGMLIPAELSYSCWVFYLLFKLQLVGAQQWGRLEANGFPFTKEQSFGSFIGLVLFSLWTSRGHLRRLVRAALRGVGDPEGDEPLSTRTALALLVLAGVALLAVAVHAGMSVWYAAAFFGIYILLAQSVTRIRAEMGIPTHELYFVGPGQILFRMLGSRTIGSGNMGAAYLFYWFNRAYRSHPMPHIAEGHKLASRAGLSPRSLTAPMFAAMLIGSLSACWSILHLYYRDGAAAKWGPFYHAQWIASAPLNELAGVLQAPTRTDPRVIGSVVIGIAATMAGMCANSRFTGWPLHPIGYAVANAWAMDHMWFSLFVAWCIKSTLARYGGATAFRKAAPFAMGLVIGDFMAGSFWSLYGTAKGMRAYSIWV